MVVKRKKKAKQLIDRFLFKLWLSVFAGSLVRKAQDIIFLKVEEKFEYILALLLKILLFIQMFAPFLTYDLKFLYATRLSMNLAYFNVVTCPILFLATEFKISRKKNAGVNSRDLAFQHKSSKP